MFILLSPIKLQVANSALIYVTVKAITQRYSQYILMKLGADVGPKCKKYLYYICLIILSLFLFLKDSYKKNNATGHGNVLYVILL